MLTILTIAALTGAVLVTRSVPTAQEMRASFDQGQRFYAAGAYDQAIERYEHVIHSRHKLLQMENVLVEVGQVRAPLQQVAPYQIGNALFKMGQDLLEAAARTRDDDQRAVHTSTARRHLREAIRYFELTESGSTVPALRALALSRIITCHYRLEAYEETIGQSRRLTQEYPASGHVEQAMYDIGWSYFQMGQFRRSIEAFEKLALQFPEGYRASRSLYQIGESYYRLQQWRDAIEAYSELVAAQRLGEMSQQELLQMKRDKIAGLVNETDLEIAAKALLRVGECHERLGATQPAVAAYELVAEQFADERRLAEEAYLRQADLYLKAGDFDASVAVYRRALERQQDDFGRARLQLLLANRFFESDRLEQAITEYGTYRELYAERASQAGLPVEGAALQIARAWFGMAEQAQAAARTDALQRAAIELQRALEAFPASSLTVPLTFNLALAHQRLGENVEAMSLFDSVATMQQAGGYRHSALFQSARIHHEAQRFAAARNIYRTLTQELDGRAEEATALFELGILERDAGQLERAIGYFLEVPAEHALHGQARIEAGRLLLQQADPDGARAALASAQTDNASSSAMIDYLLGTALSEQGDLAAAVEHFADAVSGPDATLSDRARYARGVALYRLQQFDTAAEDFAHPYADSSLTHRARRLCAAALSAAGRADDALALYQDLMQLVDAPVERAEYALALAEIDYRRGRFAQAAEAARRLLDLDVEESAPPEGRPYFLKEKGHWLAADALLRDDDPGAATDIAAVGRRAFPGGYYEADLLYLEGLGSLRGGDPDRAATAFRLLADKHAEGARQAEALYYLGYAHFNARRFSAALDAFDRAEHVGTAPELAADTALRRAECHYHMGDYEEARTAYRRVLDNFDESPLAEEALYNIGWCVMKQGAEVDAAATREAFEQYLARYPRGRHASQAHYTIGELAYNEGAYNEAYEIFRDVQRRYPDSAAATQAGSAMPELREAVAYDEYMALMELFQVASDAEDQEAIRSLIEEFDQLGRRYSDTSSGIAARVNIGVSYQKLKRWREAVDVFDEVLAEAAAGNDNISVPMRSFVERRRATIARKHL